MRAKRAYFKVKKYTYILEIILAFFLYDCVNHLFYSDDPGFQSLPVHPYWIAVLLIPCRYGLLPGIIVGITACMHIFILTLGGIPTRIEVEKFIEAYGILLPVSFVITGAYLGNIREKYKAAEKEKEALLARQEGQLQNIKMQLDAEENARRLLETRIVGETATVKALYATAKKFEGMDIANIYKGCLEILSEYLHVEKSSLYLREGDYYSLKASCGWEEGTGVEGKVAAEKSFMNMAFDAKKLVTVKDILARQKPDDSQQPYGKVLAMIPFKDDQGNPVGVVNIEKINFLHLNTPNLQLIQLIVEWASGAALSQQRYHAAKSQLILNEQTGIHYFHYFNNVLEKEFQRARLYHTDLTVAFVKLSRFGFLEEAKQQLLSRAIISLLKKFLSPLDMISHYKIDGIFVIMSPMRKQEEMTGVLDGFISDCNKIAGSSRVVTGSAQIQKEMKESSELVEMALKAVRS